MAGRWRPARWWTGSDGIAEGGDRRGVAPRKGMAGRAANHARVFPTTRWRREGALLSVVVFLLPAFLALAPAPACRSHQGMAPGTARADAHAAHGPVAHAQPSDDSSGPAHRSSCTCVGPCHRAGPQVPALPASPLLADRPAVRTGAVAGFEADPRPGAVPYLHPYANAPPAAPLV
jgi:hypothetical protein